MLSTVRRHLAWMGRDSGRRSYREDVMNASLQETIVGIDHVGLAALRILSSRALHTVRFPGRCCAERQQRTLIVLELRERVDY